MCHDGFHRKRAGDLTMSFPAHPVRENVEILRRNDAVTVFVVGAHHADVRGATA